MKGYESKLEKVKTAVSEAIKMLNEAHTGADLAEARKLLEEAAGAIKKDDFTQALSLTEKAQLAARPTTEYLLGKAKSLEASGSAAYKEDKFAEAIELWQSSLEEYGRAKELARERKENDIVEILNSTMESIEKDIEVAKRNKANTEMVALVEQANRAADAARKSYEAGEFDNAIEGFESARELYAKGANIAEEYEFDDKPMIKEAESEMEASIEACLLPKGEAFIAAASKEKGGKKEEAFTQTLQYLESISSQTQEYEELKTRAHKGLALGRIEIGTQFMEEAEKLLNKGEFYQAKEGYRKAQDHFENLCDYAVEHRLEREKREVDDLLEDCAANVKTCTDSMLGTREGVAKFAIRKVEDIRKGIRVKIRDEGVSADKMNKLEKVYASVSYLDSGGYGEVWLAQTKEGHTIALKILREPEKHEDTFFRELEIWQKLVHRNIVRLLRPRISPMPLFEMEYVDGGDLKMLIDKEAPLMPERACTIAFDIARGIEYAHSSNVIHADLKPRNILITKSEEAKISDWGLGKVATSSSKGINYTPGYAAPEQLRKELLGKKTDIYQAGVILYEMFTGTNPFDEGSLEEKDEKVLSLVPEKPSKHNPKVEPLDDLILSCLEKDPKNRPGIREFRESLSNYMKENYGIMLQVTGQTSEKVDLLCKNLMFSAKMNEYGECLRALVDLRANVSGNELKERVQSLMQAMEHRKNEGIQITDEVIDDIDTILRMIRYG